MKNTIEGFEVPIHRSLVDVILMAGLPRLSALILWTTATALAFGMRQIWILPIALCCHILLAHVTKKDQHFFDIFISALYLPKRLLP